MHSLQGASSLILALYLTLHPKVALTCACCTASPLLLPVTWERP